VLPEMPLTAIRKGAAKRIPTMAGSSEEERIIFWRYL
jgi:hypothetical protein